MEGPALWQSFFGTLVDLDSVKWAPEIMRLKNEYRDNFNYKTQEGPFANYLLECWCNTADRTKEQETAYSILLAWALSAIQRHWFRVPESQWEKLGYNKDTISILTRLDKLVWWTFVQKQQHVDVRDFEYLSVEQLMGGGPVFEHLKKKGVQYSWQEARVLCLLRRVFECNYTLPACDWKDTKNANSFN